jgi:hypothetical protein
MMDDKYVVLTACTLVALLVFLGCFLSYDYNKKLRVMAEHGYCEVTVIGRGDFAWQKCK